MADMIQIEGMEGVKAALAQFDVKVQDKAMRAGLRDAAEVMQGAVAAAAPERPALPSGNALPPGALRSDITLVVKRDAGILEAIVQPGKYTFHVARWVEYGHRLAKGGQIAWEGMVNGRRRRRGGHGHLIGDVPAHPFIRPAFEASIQASIAAFVDGLKAALKGRS